MSSNNIIDKILSDAKQLNGRLKTRDSMADELIAATMNIQSRIKIMKQFRDLADHLDQVARHRPRLQIIQYLAKENQKVKELEEENSELRQSLEEHQTTLEVIMTKYREQMDKLNSTVEMEAAYHNGGGDFQKKLQEKDEKIKEMAAVMMVAADQWEEEPKEEQRKQKLIQVLRNRNRILRQILLDVQSSADKETGSYIPVLKSPDSDSSQTNFNHLDSTTPSQSPRVFRKIDFHNHVNCSSETLNSSLSDLTV